MRGFVKFTGFRTTILFKISIFLAHFLGYFFDGGTQIYFTPNKGRLINGQIYREQIRNQEHSIASEILEDIDVQEISV